MEENLLPPRDLKFSSARTEMYAVFSHPALLHSFFLPSGKTKHVRMQPQLFPMLRHKFPIPGICKIGQLLLCIPLTAYALPSSASGK